MLLLSILALLPLPALPVAAAEPAGPTAVSGVPAGPAVTVENVEPDVWPGYAVPDADAARQGRSALPFTQQQIETLGRLLRQTQRATAAGRGRTAARPHPAVSGSMRRAMDRFRRSR